MVSFVVCALALAGVAHVIGEATDQLGSHIGPAATGIVQSAVGNLPELFVAIFALQAGLIVVVQASLIGSILSNALLVLGLAFYVGGAKHGVLEFESQAPRMIAILLLLAVCALVLPTLAQELHLPAGAHEQALSVVCAIVLLLVLAVQTRAMLTQGQRTVPGEARQRGQSWPLAAAFGVLAACGIAAAFVSDWFVDALQPAMHSLSIAQAFAGLVVVAIAGNAVENVSASSSPRAATPSTRSPSCSTHRCRSRWCSPRCWCSSPRPSEVRPSPSRSRRCSSRLSWRRCSP